MLAGMSEACNELNTYGKVEIVSGDPAQAQNRLKEKLSQQRCMASKGRRKDRAMYQNGGCVCSSDMFTSGRILQFSVY